MGQQGRTRANKTRANEVGRGPTRENEGGQGPMRDRRIKTNQGGRGQRGRTRANEVGRGLVSCMHSQLAVVRA